MNNTQIETKPNIVIKRGEKVLTQKSAEILINSNYIDIFPNDSKSYFVEPGFVGIFINRRKHLDFDLDTNESKTFVIKEGITDWRFLWKYLSRLFVLAVLVYFSISDIISKERNAMLLIITIVFGYAAFKKITDEYFYLQEL